MRQRAARDGVAGRRGRRLGWALAAVAFGVSALGAAAWAVRDVPAALGRLPEGARAERARRSPQFRAGVFRNSLDTRLALPGTGRRILWEMLFGHRARRPPGGIPVRVPEAAADPASAPPGELNVIWYGHATALIEIEGRRILLDPVWSDRCSPSTRLGPHRLHPVPAPLDRLPRLDAVLVSHDHYDHLDMATIRALRDAQSAPFLVPLGVGAHLERWGVPPDRIVELDWGERTRVAGLDLVAAPARHFSGRGLVRDRTLWASWVVAGHRRRVFCSGDSGYFGGYAGIGTEHGPFDLTLVQVGAYSDAWPEIHMFPEEAVTAHLDLRGGLLVPVHWGTFDLAPHGWADPVDRLCRAAGARGVRLAVPRPGERVVVDHPPPVDGWWRSLD
ncbi:MBL fold metallo-hydrolase [Plantactinospora sp. WMMB334]|uniref:MBL fold metallo-hydrolase n=1 Tax=Plantactinospora sp. WMMB334 TaxID=3404119 RepID=UPI003B93C4B7